MTAQPEAMLLPGTQGTPFTDTSKWEIQPSKSPESMKVSHGLLRAQLNVMSSAPSLRFLLLPYETHDTPSHLNFRKAEEDCSSVSCNIGIKLDSESYMCIC